MLSKDDLLLRAKLWNDVTQSIHDFFRSREYLEVRTPLIVKSPGMEPNLDPVGVDLRLVGPAKAGLVTPSLRAGLITSPEYSMKKLLGAGLERIYTLTSVFRNVEKMGERWSVEFTMLEWYRQGADYNECMKDTEELVDGILLGGADPSSSLGVERKPWPRISYVKEFEKQFGVHPADMNESQALDLIKKYSLSTTSNLEPRTSSLVADLFQWHIQPALEKQYPRFFLVDYPVAEAALAQKNPDGRSAQRFEGYVNGIEICNGFTELVDATEQRSRFLLEQEERRLAGKEVFPVDEELLSGLSSVASPTYGNALGVDRLIMLKVGVADIDSIHLFPPSNRF